MSVGIRRERLDLTAKKEDLTRVLGDKAPRYWEIFTEFIQAKLSKPEFDLAAKKALGDSAIILHNQFILAILHNARCITLPANASQFARDKSPDRNELLKVANGKIRKPAKAHGVQTHTILKRKSLSGVIRIQHILNGEQSQLPLYPRMRALDKQLVAQPELLVLRQKMKNTANGTSVSDVSNDSVQLMMQAVQMHLQRALAMCIAEKKGENRNISKKDLWCAVKNNPRVFSKTTPQSQERALLQLK